MLTRNIVEISLIIILFIVGIIIYFYLKRKIDDAESDLVIRKKKEIKEDIED
ncbi:hypothetical protein [Lachnoanaerobaculum saburreum]|jgi:hypothetical protein|uniref:Uncharacterized protein n=1 Tax=Lachnoanaerobaculum saburreum DSM 3986 TaxID=887325 RepID=E6LR17_9FIRM|nr:hypothetical protein [Lachnoanaerobaculum saburreum]EFU75713.1 hypothetical protein HMPREF0381_2402 [Lachnoanaerobaculum saburreum DSM 3986]